MKLVPQIPLVTDARFPAALVGRLRGAVEGDAGLLLGGGPLLGTPWLPVPAEAIPGALRAEAPGLDPVVCRITVALEGAEPGSLAVVELGCQQGDRVLPFYRGALRAVAVGSGEAGGRGFLMETALLPVGASTLAGLAHNLRFRLVGVGGRLAPTVRLAVTMTGGLALARGIPSLDGARGDAVTGGGGLSEAPATPRGTAAGAVPVPGGTRRPAPEVAPGAPASSPPVATRTGPLSGGLVVPRVPRFLARVMGARRKGGEAGAAIPAESQRSRTLTVAEPDVIEEASIRPDGDPTDHLESDDPVAAELQRLLTPLSGPAAGRRGRQPPPGG